MIAHSSARTVFWISADKQASIDMGDISVDQARDELLAQCADDEQRAAIVAGNFEVAS